LSHNLPDDNVLISKPGARFLPAVATKAISSVMTGVGLTNAFAGVTNSVLVQAVDLYGAD